MQCPNTFVIVCCYDYLGIDSLVNAIYWGQLVEKLSVTLT